MEKSTASPSVRDLMPSGYLSILADRTNSTSTPDLAQIVLRERYSSKHWPAVLALAEETNPEGYAQWAAANPEKLPKVAA